MTPHRQLLADYVEKHSEEAFHELVKLYIGMVHSAAVRLVNGDIHRAQDVTQTVFADLARDARHVSGEATIGGWLHRRTCRVALNMMRGERRRQNRERQAIEMNALHENFDEVLGQVAPVLDEAIDELNAPDRHAILLRFFERNDFRAIGEALGSNEDAAQKRVARALDKLRVLLVRRGIALSGTALGLALGGTSASAAPAGLAVSVSTAALTAAHAGNGFTLTTLKLIVMTKLKATAIAAITAVILAGVGATVVLVTREKPYEPIGKPNPTKILQEAKADTYAGRYKDALAKHIWFRENALKYQPSLVGVRDSFALMDWGELATKYPPAMKKLNVIREKAEKMIRDKSATKQAGMQAFAQFVSINYHRNDDNKTTELFVWLDANNPNLAKAVFPMVEPVLVKTREYTLYGRYIDPDRSYQQALQMYNMTKKSSQSNTNKQLEEFSHKSFWNRAATLVAMLSANDRKADADRIAAKAAEELNDPAFLAQLEEAKNGVLPKPWP